MNQLSFGWDDAIRPLRTSSMSPAEPVSNKRKRGRESVDHLSVSPTRRIAGGIKKHRGAARPSYTVPVRRRLEGLSHGELFELVETLSEQNPEFHAQIARLAPPITAESALHSLQNYLEQVRQAIPYDSNEKMSEYGYLRVQPLLHSFFVALADYTVALLPPNEASLNKSLQFLDAATDLVHEVPEWENPMNNFYKTRAYGELASSWAQCLQGLVDNNQIVRFDADRRLAHHAQASGGRLSVTCPTQPVFSIAPLPLVA